MAGVVEDETSCGPLCPHPACWQSNIRKDKGFPKLIQNIPLEKSYDLDLPTVKVYNMLEDYGDDHKDKYPAKYAGKPDHERSISFPNFKEPIRTNSIRATRAPATSPKSSTSNPHERRAPPMKLIEVQEVFDPEDLGSAWDDAFVTKKYYVWVPNSKKKKRKRRKKKSVEQTFESSETPVKPSQQSVRFRDLTEDMIPRELEYEQMVNKRPWNKKRAQALRSPTMMRHFPLTPRTRGSSKMDYDQEGISELLDLPREILVQVLEHTRQSDLMSRDKIMEIIKRFTSSPQLERGNTNVSLTSNELLQQKKMNLHAGNKNLRQPELMETKPVYHLDDDDLEEQGDEYDSDQYGSLKELYFRNDGAEIPKDFPKYKKPLPSIGGRAASAGEPYTGTKIPSISLGLPELPSGVRQTKAFTYNRRNQFDFTLAPVPTPPTSVRSTETPGSDHGTTIRVNVPSTTSGRSEYGSPARENIQKAGQQSTETTPLHAVSPTFSTRVPHAPATTPATYLSPAKSPKSAPLPMRSQSESTMTETPVEWGGAENRANSPSHIIRAPVNTPGSVQHEQSGLDPIQENGGEGYADADHPISRSGRSVRFEIPEVPPPPSSPQELETDQGATAPKDPSRNTVTVNTTIPTDTPFTKSQSALTAKTDQNTINTAIPKEVSFVKTPSSITRELSMVSTPEPWPSVNEADFDVTPSTRQSARLHSSKTETTEQSNGASGSDKTKEAETKLSQEPSDVSSENLPDSDYVNKNVEPVGQRRKAAEERRKAESPAPPPPSPEPKDEGRTFKSGKMSTVHEHDKIEGSHSRLEDSGSLTVTQIHPKGPQKGSKRLTSRALDTFVNIDIPATVREGDSPTVAEEENNRKTIETIAESDEPDREELQDGDKSRNRLTTTLSIQSTLGDRTISQQTVSEDNSSVVEPAISQASHGPAVSEDLTEKPDRDRLMADWEEINSREEKREEEESRNTEPKQMAGDREGVPEMMEDGGDHEGFKADLRKEYEKLMTDREEGKEAELQAKKEEPKGEEPKREEPEGEESQEESAEQKES